MLTYIQSIFGQYSALSDGSVDFTYIFGAVLVLMAFWFVFKAFLVLLNWLFKR